VANKLGDRLVFIEKYPTTGRTMGKLFSYFWEGGQLKIWGAGDRPSGPPVRELYHWGEKKKTPLGEKSPADQMGALFGGKNST